MQCGTSSHSLLWEFILDIWGMLLQIECALTELALYNRPSVFSNKLYAEKYVFFSVMYMAHICTRWDALMSFQEALEEGATDYFQETKEKIWEYIR